MSFKSFYKIIVEKNGIIRSIKNNYSLNSRVVENFSLKDVNFLNIYGINGWRIF